MDKIREELHVNSRLSKHDFFYIMKAFEIVKQSSSSYVLVDVNIKNFRYYNAKHGHEEANEIIDVIYEVLLSCLKENEYVAHIHADTYVMLMHYEDMDCFIYERLVDILDCAYRTNNKNIARNIFLSMGLCTLEQKELKFLDALNMAFISRKESSGIAKRCHTIELCDEGIYNTYMHRIDLEIKTADAYKNYEFIPYLQPKVDLKTGKICGAEALLRWVDEDGNFVPLYDFLPILNKNSYIQLIDLDIFDQLCKYLEERIRNEERVVPISFNFSKTSFYSADIQKRYTDIFEQYNIPKELIEIEFMESISLDDTDRMKTIVSQFKEYGFRCSLDDFGNGYSSFNVLLNAPFDVVKMDRQFFLDNLKGDHKLIIKTVIDLIHSLHMNVVAEGVETKEHIDYLKACNCDYVQGYYCYKPMSIEAFNQALAKEKENEEKE